MRAGKDGLTARFFKIGRHVLTTIGELRTWIEVQETTDSVGS